ncbi:MAG: ATP-binding cassette domain-containing protein [Sphingomonadales bacterium]|nr:ATP-binding cassette domain-containing protein [Sphingomonadales bacterium]
MADGPQTVAPPADPLIAALAQLAERFGVPFSPAMIAGLALDGRGRLPLHQAEPALEVLGLNCDPQRPKRLPHRSASYPALVALSDDRLAIVHELRDGDALVWRPESGETQWEPLAGVEIEYAGWIATVFGDPSALRDAGQPWELRARTHWFWSEVAKMRRRFAPVWVATLIVNLLALALPLFSMNVYDRVIPNRTQATLWVLAVGVLGAFAIEYALRRARSAVLDEIGHELDLKLSQKIYSKILAAPLADRKGHTGNLVARVSEYAIVREFYASTTVMLMIDMAFLALFVALIAYIAGWLALVPLIAMAVMALIGLRLRGQVVDAAREAQADHGLQQTLLVESIAGLETLKSISGEGAMLGRWRKLAELGAHSQQRLKDVSTSAIGLASTFQQVSNIALIVGGYYLFDAGKITMGAIVAIVMLSSRSLAPAGQLAFLLTRGQQAQQTLESIQKLWDAPDERRMGSASLTPSVRSANIRLEGLEFSYPEASVESLTGINLEIRPGDRIAIVGRVASGKSTLGRVLCGLYQPTGGTMLIDGIDSRQYRPQELRDAFRFVGQDASLFSGTIKDNLALGAGVIADERLIESLRFVGAEQFLSQDAGGFDRGVGESGSRLSGGQRSFLALARALVRPSKLLFLDEPTGAMDSQTEKLFVERLSQSLTSEQTLVISTHRPALFAICNRLIVLDKGRIVADGPKDQIISSAGVGLKP